MLEPTLAIIKPSVTPHSPNCTAILREIKQAGFHVLKTRRSEWTRREAEKFYAEHLEKPYGRRLVEHAISGSNLALLLLKQNAIKDWRALIGPTHFYACVLLRCLPDAHSAQWTHPGSLRARYGVSDTRNGLHGSSSPSEVRREFAIVFEGIDLDYVVSRG